MEMYLNIAEENLVKKFFEEAYGSKSLISFLWVVNFLFLYLDISLDIINKKLVHIFKSISRGRSLDVYRWYLLFSVLSDCKHGLWFLAKKTRNRKKAP